jgi:demethylmenaquinone methyltransferase/2-methoxy-6-polyprenyl-1,4-benzoquinol methylase
VPGPMSARGAKPAGSTDEASAAAAVREMFDGIAPRYDTLNHVLSLNVDRLWWWRTARRFRGVLERPEAADFSHQMLVRGANKFTGRSAASARAVAIEADALHLPLANDSTDLITTAFGFRNLANYRAGLEEFHRVLKPGAELGILDFSEPGGIPGRLYNYYFNRILPWIGSKISGIAGPYTYLPTSVRNFPAPGELMATMQDVGFTYVSWTPYTFGVAGLYRAVKQRQPLPQA